MSDPEIVQVQQKCGIQHGFSDARCERKAGHPGRCYTRWSRDSHRPQNLTRIEWLSEEGKFFMHYGYMEQFVGWPRG